MVENGCLLAAHLHINVYIFKFSKNALIISVLYLDIIMMLDVPFKIKNVETFRKIPPFSCNILFFPAKEVVSRIRRFKGSNGVSAGENLILFHFNTVSICSTQILLQNHEPPHSTDCTALQASVVTKLLMFSDIAWLMSSFIVLSRQHSVSSAVS